MDEDLENFWRSLRPIVKENFSFGEIKDLIAAAALPVEKLSHLQQKSLPAKSASKGELLDAINDLIYNSNNSIDAIKRIVAKMLEYRKDIENKLSKHANKYNLKLVGGKILPLDFQVTDAIHDFSEEAKTLLEKSYQRYGDHDYSGAMSAICSALDAVTGHLYKTHSLGNPHDDSYQQRVSRSFAILEPVYRKEFSQIMNDECEVNKLWQNYKGAVNQAAYVMGALRRKASDVHGSSACSQELIRHAIDSSTFIIRSITYQNPITY